jgi:hypothetical protein
VEKDPKFKYEGEDAINALVCKSGYFSIENPDADKIQWERSDGISMVILNHSFLRQFARWRN